MPEAPDNGAAGAPQRIDFGIGQPSADLLPLDLLEQATRQWLARADAAELNYGARIGDAGFRIALGEFLRQAYAEPVDPDNLFLTAGASQALDLICTVLTRSGDTIFVEQPTYHLARGIFAHHGLKVIACPTDAEGLDVERLEEQLAAKRPALLYTIPTFHNPGGHTLSEARRQRLTSLSREYGFTIVADEVYHLLAYGVAPPATLASRSDAGNVISVGSFSKILAPGLRLGWLQCSAAMHARFAQCGVVQSGGSLNHMTSRIVAAALGLGLQHAHLTRLRNAYGRRLLAMDEALRLHVGARATWLLPDGGYFIWLQLRRIVDTASLLPAAHAAGVSFKPGAVFSTGSDLAHCLRLSFAHYDEATIRAGIRRLGAVLSAA